MQIPFTTRKSAGVAVSPAIHRTIAEGNAARDRLKWDDAARAYRRALQPRPDLAHIWVQLGHAQKELGDLAAAEQAYAKAAELRPKDADPLMHLGHVAKMTGDLAAASRYYVQSFRTDPGNADAVAELQRVIVGATGQARESTIELLKSTLLHDEPEEAPARADIARRARQALDTAIEGLGPDAAPLQQAATLLAAIERQARADRPDPADGSVALVFDASDLVGYFARDRLPTGIQRVQIEAITGAIAAGDHQVRICCFIDGREDWLEIPLPLFRRLAALSVMEGGRKDPEWLMALSRLHLTLVLAEPFEFPRGAYLINLGTSWWMQNYFLYVRQAKTQYGVRYIPFVHDFIPVMHPAHCVKQLVQDFVSWAVGVFAHADHYLVNSEATKRDLFQVAKILGGVVHDQDVAVIPLNADFRSSSKRHLTDATLSQWGLQGQAFVLMVGTVESRKGHTIALDAWTQLLARHSPRTLPKLVCVGRRGWLNGAVYERLSQNDTLAKQVVMLADLSDEELALLYRSCQFTIYPSLYEGWGLPITEALCYGKPVITADNSSLPEAGGDFAVYVETGSVDALAAAVERMSLDTPYRDALAARIAADFKPRTWREVAGQIDTELTRLATRGKGHETTYRAPEALWGRYYPVARSTADRIWPGIGSGEIFRAGLGWHWPTPQGCWTRPQGAELAIALPDGPTTLYLLLMGLPANDCSWHIYVKDGPTLAGTLPAGERKLVQIEVDTRTLHVHLRGSRADLLRMSTGGVDREQRAAIGLAGFALHRTGDDQARLTLLQALAFGALETLDAYADPDQPRTAAIISSSQTTPWPPPAWPTNPCSTNAVSTGAARADPPST